MTSCSEHICSSLMDPYAIAHGSDMTKKIAGSGYGCVVEDWDGKDVGDVICMPASFSVPSASPVDMPAPVDGRGCSVLTFQSVGCRPGTVLVDLYTMASCSEHICSSLMDPYAIAHGSDMTKKIVGSGYGCVVEDWDGMGVYEVICMPASFSTPSASPQENITPDMPTPDMPTPDMPTPDMPTPDMPTPDMPTPDMPTPDMPTPDMPTPDMPTPDMPTPDMPTPDMPTPDMPTPDMPTPDVPAPQDNITAPVDMPAPQENITTPMYMPTPKMEAPVATPQDTTTPVDMPAPQEITTPVDMPTPKMETPVDMPAPQDNSSSPVMPTPEECLNLTAVNASSEDACPSGTELADEKSMKDCSAHICGELIGKNEVARGKDFTITGSADGCKVAPWDGKTKTDEQICMPKGGGGGGGNHTVLIVLLVIGGVLLVGAIIWYIRHRRAQAIGTGYSAEMLNAEADFETTE